MATPRSTDSKNTQQSPRRSADQDAALADDIETVTAAESDGLQELSFDGDSRSDRHSAIGSEQSAQSDNAPDTNVDELDEGNDIGEQDEQ